MKVTAITQQGGLFIPNIMLKSADNEVIDVELAFINEPPSKSHTPQHSADVLKNAVGILKGVDDVAYQNAIRSEWQ